MLAFTTLCFSLLLSFVHSFPLLEVRDVWAPPITSPKENDVWTIGTKQLVTWDTSTKPQQVTNPVGQIILGHMENDSLNLQFDNPLAKGFNLTDGQVEVTVPNVPPRQDYLIVLFGDSGNTSPTFVIAQISDGSSSSSKSALAAATSSTLISTPIPITGSVITGGETASTEAAPSDAPSSVLTSIEASPTSITPTPATPTPSISLTSLSASPSSTTSSSSTSSAASGTLGASTSSSAALSLHDKQSNIVLSVCMSALALMIFI